MFIKILKEMEDIRYEIAKYCHIDDFLSFISTCNEFREDLNLQRLAKVYDITERIYNLKHFVYIWGLYYYRRASYTRPAQKDNKHSIKFDQELVKIRATIKRGWFDDRYLEEFTREYASSVPDDLGDHYNQAIYETRLRLAIQDNKREDYKIFFNRKEPFTIITDKKFGYERKIFLYQCLKYSIPCTIDCKRSYEQMINYYTNPKSPEYHIRINKHPDYNQIPARDVEALLILALKKDRLEIAYNLASIPRTSIGFGRNVCSCEGLRIWLAHQHGEFHFSLHLCGHIISRRNPEMLEILLKYVKPRFDPVKFEKVIKSQIMNCIRRDSSECYAKMIEYYPQFSYLQDESELGYDMQLYINTLKL